MAANDYKPAKGGAPVKPLLPGTRFGFLTVRAKVNTKPGSSGGQKYRIECICGMKRTVPRFYLFRPHNPLRHCGCMRVKADEPYTKNSYYAMHSRCYYPGHCAWEHYGGRGIKVCWRWHKDNPEGWENFKKDMGIRPKGTSIDRIDPNGDYEPFHSVTGERQCRWATAKEQSANQRWNTKYKAPPAAAQDDDAILKEVEDTTNV